MTQPIFVDPSLAGPDVLFSTGLVADGEEQFDPTIPDIQGEADTGWNITQWATPANEIFDPAQIDRADPLDTDPLLGTALASWHTGTSSGGSTLAIFGGIADGGVTFRLGASGGANRDTFLQSTGYASGAVTFDRQISFTANERIVSASAGDGTAIAFNGFTVFFNAADNPSYSAVLPQTEMFLQVPLTDFRGEPGQFTTLSPGNTYQQIYNTSSLATADNGQIVADESSNYLGFTADTGAPHRVSIDLNQALLRMVELMAQQNPVLASAYLDLSRWSLGSVYSGVETGGGDGTDAASLAMDIAHPLVTRDDAVPVSSATALATVQSIDNGAYAESEDQAVIRTLAGATDTIRLTNAAGAQTLTGNGHDTVLAGNGIDATLHGLGSALSVVGSAGTSGWISIDGTAPLSVSGSFASLSVNAAGTGATISATVLAANLVLGGADARVSIRGLADATLGGSNSQFASGGGIVALDADNIGVDQNGAGSQTIFLNDHQASITQSGTGTQTVAGQPSGGGVIVLRGGAGTQSLWTGGSDASIDASGSGHLDAFIQSGSHGTVSLDGETTSLTALGGTLLVSGSDAGGSDRVSVQSGSASITGGAEALVASLDGDGTLAATAGSGTQTLFGGGGTLVAMGSHQHDGSQTVVNGADPTQSSTIFGGKTAQTIWTGNASDTIVSSTEAGDATGRIDAMIQGGSSAYWGGVESASLSNLGGTLDAFLVGDGAVSILANMTGHTSTTLNGFDSRRDTVTLGGVSDLALVHVSQSGNNSLLVFGDSRVLLEGILDPTLSANNGVVSVAGWN